MDYQKVTISLSPDNEVHRSLLMDSLAGLGFESFVENEANIEAYIQADRWAESLMDEAGFPDLFSYRWEAELIPDQNWNEVWEKNYFQPLLIADRCLVRAPFHEDYPGAEFEIVIEPQMAFGTGNHETTSMMVENILDLDLRGKTVLDMGCGTGILAMLASMKGAHAVTAIDIDRWAVDSAAENCRTNNCSNIEVLKGDASLLNDQKFDVIFANIQRNVLLADMNQYQRVLHPGGIILMSGFYLEDLNIIQEKASVLGLQFLSYSFKNNWIVAVFLKPVFD